jgi:hypothetical protein
MLSVMTLYVVANWYGEAIFRGPWPPPNYGVERRLLRQRMSAIRKIDRLLRVELVTIDMIGADRPFAGRGDLN